MDIPRTVQLVTDALLTGVTSPALDQPAPDQPAVSEAVRSLRDAVARLSGDPFAQILMAKLGTLHVTSAQAEPWRVHVRILVGDLSEAALHTLVPRAEAILAITQPPGMVTDGAADDTVTADRRQSGVGGEELRNLTTDLDPRPSAAGSLPPRADADAVHCWQDC
jgi:hypothetical protein